MLKADLHTHSADDFRDRLDYSSEMLIDAVARAGLTALAIASHEGVTYTERLSQYAAVRGVLLIPAMEALIEGKHVVILNPGTRHRAARTFDALRAAGRGDAAFIAPHPYYPTRSSLGRLLERHIDLFDAVEICALYFRWCNPNRRAIRVAHEHQLALVGSTDTHRLPYTLCTYTNVDAEASVASVIHAIRERRVNVVSEPRPSLDALTTAFRLVWGYAHGSTPSDELTFATNGVSPAPKRGG